MFLQACCYLVDSIFRNSENKQYLIKTLVLSSNKSATSHTHAKNSTDSGLSVYTGSGYHAWGQNSYNHGMIYYTQAGAVDRLFVLYFDLKAALAISANENANLLFTFNGSYTYNKIYFAGGGDYGNIIGGGMAEKTTYYDNQYYFELYFKHFKAYAKNTTVKLYLIASFI